MKNSRPVSTADVTHTLRNRTAALHESIFHCKNCMCSVNITCTLKISLSKCLILAMIDVLPGGWVGGATGPIFSTQAPPQIPVLVWPWLVSISIRYVIPGSLVGIQE